MNETTFVAPSTGRAARAVLFDTFGTVVDWRTGVADQIRIFAAEHRLPVDAFDLTARWRAEYQPSMARIRSGSRGYVPLDQLHFENLLTALAKSGVEPDDFADDDLRTLSRAWERLPAWPDSAEGLRQLRRHVIVGPLSNANTALLVNMARNADLPWDVVIGMDLLRAYKPDPATYLGAANLLRLDPGEVMLVAAHNYDLQAARDQGLATAFILRGNEHGPAQTSDLAPTAVWDICVDDLRKLAVAFTDTTT